MAHPMAALIAAKMAKGDVPDDKDGGDELTSIGHDIAAALGTKLTDEMAKKLSMALGDLMDVHEGGGSDQPDDAEPEGDEPEPEEGAPEAPPMPPEGA